MQSEVEVNKEDLYMSKINCKEKRTVGKTKKGINVEKYNRSLKIKIIKKRKEKKKEEIKKKKKGKLHRTAKAQRRVRGL